MEPTFTKDDLKFLKIVGIRADDMPLDDAIAATAEEESATEHDPVLEFLKENNLPINRENYLYVAYFGKPPKELDAEQEAELPDNIREDRGDA
jgi:hypothetical protein